MELRAAAVLQLALITVLGKMMMPFGFVDMVQNERKCQYLRAGRMLKIRCFDMNLKEVPQYLKSSVEVLDLTFNRIKKLKRSSFQNYKNIKFLLLYENKVQSVEAGTFSHLNSLQEIDLSNNALVTIPLEILQLPSLRNLYVDGNELFNLAPDLLTLSTPIAAPLEYLNIADCGLKNIPDFGVLPKLWHVNASMNPLTEFSVETLANMCNLRGMDLTKTEFSDCACQQVNQYLRYIGANTKYVPVCMESFDSSVCPELYNSTVHSEAFKSCKSETQRAEERKWLVTGSYFGFGLLALLISVVFFWWCCRRRSKRKRAMNRTQMQKATPKHQPLVSPTTALKAQHNDRSKLQDSDCV